MRLPKKGHGGARKFPRKQQLCFNDPPFHAEKAVAGVIFALRALNKCCSSCVAAHAEIRRREVYQGVWQHEAQPKSLAFA